MASYGKVPIILASSSPRRQELLQNLCLDFIVKPSDAEETFDDGLKPAEVVELLAERKATAVARFYQEGLVIGSDTIVSIEGKILGKPKDREDARSMLSGLSGKVHSVFSGLAVLNANNGEKRVGHVETKVLMREITDNEIENYISTGEPMDKAGSYAIQGIGSLFVTRIDGDYFSVVGLPIHLLNDYLYHFGVDVLGQMVNRTT